MFCVFLSFFTSYIEQNLRSSTCYRLYDKTLPAWLHNRPKKYVAQCVSKIEAASYIKAGQITKEGENKFAVPSETNDMKYSIYLGDDHTLPSCTCFDWKKHLIPCKHMMGVFKHSAGISWLSLGKDYRESVFFKIDYEVLGLEDETVDKTFKEIEKVNEKNPSNKPLQEPPHPTLPEDNLVFSELPKRVSSTKTKASHCREILHQIKSLTFVVDDMDALEQLGEELRSSFEKLKQAAPTDFGLTLEDEK